MSLWESIVLGIVQGLTEFLPISSSGHLTLFGSLLGLSEGDGNTYRFFVVMIHFGTLLAILLYYRRDLLALLAAFGRSLPRGLRPAAGDERDLRIVWAILLGTLPAVVVAVTLDDFFSRQFERPLPAAIFLAVTGFILLSTRWTGPRAAGEVSVGRGVLVGVAQAVAILPGISRSGSTIAMGLALGIERKEAARFAFLLAVPALVGAALFDVLKVESLAAVDWLVVLSGTLAAFLSGYLALVWLIRLLARASFWRFAWYCWGASVAGVLLLLLRG